ncbi:hypothetical protein DBV15_07084, partial [Temnothorax longispinosus]
CTSGVPSLSMNAGNPRETVPGQRSSRTRPSTLSIVHEGCTLEGERASRELERRERASSGRNDASGLAEERRGVARGCAGQNCEIDMCSHTPNLALERILESLPPFGGSTKVSLLSYGLIM